MLQSIQFYRLLPVIGICAMMLAAPAVAESPAAIRTPGAQRAKISFDRFAETWMEKIQRLEAQHRNQPTVRPGPSKPIVTYRGYGDDYSVELRPTGHPSAPYVGILRYSEHLFSCGSIEATQCTIASTVPVTEIFRFEGGRWVY